jgi:hypothetical protein
MNAFSLLVLVCLLAFLVHPRSPFLTGCFFLSFVVSWRSWRTGLPPSPAMKFAVQVIVSLVPPLQSWPYWQQPKMVTTAFDFTLELATLTPTLTPTPTPTTTPTRTPTPTPTTTPAPPNVPVCVVNGATNNISSAITLTVGTPFTTSFTGFFADFLPRQLFASPVQIPRYEELTKSVALLPLSICVRSLNFLNLSFSSFVHLICLLDRYFDLRRSTAGGSFTLPPFSTAIPVASGFSGVSPITVLLGFTPTPAQIGSVFFSVVFSANGLGTSEYMTFCICHRLLIVLLVFVRA